MCGRSFRYFCRPKWLLRCGYIFGPELFSTLEMSFGSNSQTTSTPGTMRSFTILPHLACFTKPALWISFQSYVPVGQMTCRLEKKIRYKPICFRAAFGGEKKHQNDRKLTDQRWILHESTHAEYTLRTRNWFKTFRFGHLCGRIVGNFRWNHITEFTLAFCICYCTRSKHFSRVYWTHKSRI